MITKLIRLTVLLSLLSFGVLAQNKNIYYDIQISVDDNYTVDIKKLLNDEDNLPERVCNILGGSYVKGTNTSTNEKFVGDYGYEKDYYDGRSSPQRTKWISKVIHSRETTKNIICNVVEPEHLELKKYYAKTVTFFASILKTKPYSPVHEKIRVNINPISKQEISRRLYKKETTARSYEGRDGSEYSEPINSYSFRFEGEDRSYNFYNLFKMNLIASGTIRSLFSATVRSTQRDEEYNSYEILSNVNIRKSSESHTCGEVYDLELKVVRTGSFIRNTYTINIKAYYDIDINKLVIFYVNSNSQNHK